MKNLILAPIFILLVGIQTVHSMDSVYPCNGQPGAFHTNPDSTVGGFVADSAIVDSSITITPDASICSRATVIEGAVITDRAVVSGRATVRGNVRIGGLAQVYGDAYITNQNGEQLNVIDSAKIYGQALLNGSVLVGGSSEIFGWAKITEFAQVMGQSKVCGSSLINKNMILTDDESNCLQK